MLSKDLVLRLCMSCHQCQYISKGRNFTTCRASQGLNLLYCVKGELKKQKKHIYIYLYICYCYLFPTHEGSTEGIFPVNLLVLFLSFDTPTGQSVTSCSLRQIYKGPLSYLANGQPFKLLGITYLVGKIKLKLLFQVPLAK